MAAVLGNIPELVADLDDASPASIIPYLDGNPKQNSVSKSTYRQTPGTVLVVAMGSTYEEGDIEGYTHRVELHLSALPGKSGMTLVNAIMNGVPVPGDGQRWRYCPILPGLLPTSVPVIERVTDEQGIDHWVLYTLTKETGDS